MTFRLKHSLIILHLIISYNLFAQSDNKQTLLKISYANDLFTKTDQYFTQGIRIELISPIFRKFPVSYLSFLPKKNAILYHNLAIQQDGFTPTSIRYDSVLQDDRPYCGSMFFTNSQYNLLENKKTLWHTQLDLGAIGPLALGFEEQTAIHKAINDQLPHGWKNEIQNDLILNYKVELQQTFLYSKIADITTLSQIRIGTMFTDATAGAALRVGIRNNWLQNTMNDKKGKLQIFGIAKAQVKAVAYNATLQGGLINRSSVYTIRRGDIQRLVAQLDFGFCTSYKNLLLEYTQTYLGREFKTGTNHAWGKIGLSIGF